MSNPLVKAISRTGIFCLVVWGLALPVTAQQSETDGRVSVKAKGAKGDGATDDAPAIKAAIAALPPEGGVLVFPPGTYAISTTITPDKKLKIECEGATGLNGSMHGSCRLLKSRSLNGVALYFGPTTQGSVVEGLEVDGSKGNGGDGIQILANSIVLRDVAVVNQGGIGIRIGEDQLRDGTQANSFYLDRVRSANNASHGFYIHKLSSKGWRDANAGTMINCVAQFNKGDGLLIGGGRDNTFIGFLAEANKGAGVHLAKLSGTESFFGGDLNEGNSGGNVVLDSGNTAGSFFLGVNTGKAIRENGTFKSGFWNQDLGLKAGGLK